MGGSYPRTGKLPSNWLAAGLNRPLLTDLQDNVSHNGSSVASAGVAHADRVGGLVFFDILGSMGRSQSQDS